MPIFLNNQILEVVESTIHLGNPLGSKHINNVKEAIGEMNKRLNVAMSLFGNVKSSILHKLFKVFCTAFYGSQLWDYSLQTIQSVWVSWRKAIRKIYKLPQRANCHLLPLLCKDVSIEQQLHSRFLRFICDALNSKNECVNICARAAINGSRSAACNSVNFSCHKYKININIAL